MGGFSHKQIIKHISSEYAKSHAVLPEIAQKWATRNYIYFCEKWLCPLEWLVLYDKWLEQTFKRKY